jgi:hypothetical protein
MTGVSILHFSKSQNHCTLLYMFLETGWQAKLYQNAAKSLAGIFVEA